MLHLYVDMDGVLTDFSKQLADLLDKPLDRDWDFGNDPKIWKKIDDAGKDFWAKMPWMPDGHELWDAVKKYKPTILTAPSRHASSKEGKTIWLKEHLPKVPHIIDSKKYLYAKKDYILIDDRKKNIDKWEAAGGTGILHTDTKSTLKKLKEITDDMDRDAGTFQEMFGGSPLQIMPDYSGHVISTPRDGGEYHVLRIPKDTAPPKEGVHLNIGGIDLVVVSVKTPEDIAKGRGGPVAKSMIEHGIGWDVLCLPPEHESVMKSVYASAVKKLRELASSLVTIGKSREAAQLGTISERWENFLKNQASPGSSGKTDINFPAVPVKKFLWDSRDERMQIVKDVLDNIIRRRKGTHISREKLVDVEDILKNLRKMSVTEYTDPTIIESEKKNLMNKAIGIDGSIAELIGLLFKPVTNKNERQETENLMKNVAKPFLFEARKDPFQSDFGGRSTIFNEMARRAQELDLSGIPDSYVRIVNACLDRVSGLVEKEANLQNYFVHLINYMRLQKRSAQDIAGRVMKGLELWPIPETVDKTKARLTAWKTAFSTVAKSPEELLKVILSFKMTSDNLDKIIMPIQELAAMVKMPVTQFSERVDTNASDSDLQPPAGNNRNPGI